MRYHNRPEKCLYCERTFGTITHLNRHINDAHNTTKQYNCSVAGCDYSKTYGCTKSFRRKDNWKRHMKDIHGRTDENWSI
jgi:uncharacterized Zn-finger protein